VVVAPRFVRINSRKDAFASSTALIFYPKFHCELDQIHALWRAFQEMFSPGQEQLAPEFLLSSESESASESESELWSDACP
jgi:hypothetical protein